MADPGNWTPDDDSGMVGDSFLVDRGARRGLAGLTQQERDTVQLETDYVIGNRFLVKRLLGMGGMGVVYLVFDKLLREERALKVMLPSLVATPDARSRFFREIKVLQRLMHPGIVRIFDCGMDEAEKRAYFTMEYIDGKPLSAILDDGQSLANSKKPPLNASTAVRYIIEILHALEHAHTHVIHRDLKPQNIMFRKDGTLVILDFGLAKIVSSEQRLRSTTGPGGTPFYMSPEQSRRGAQIGIGSDIYSVGVILYEMLTNDRPTGRFMLPSRINKSANRRLDRVVLKCLESNAKNRYASASELRKALEGAMAPRRVPLPSTTSLISALFGLLLVSLFVFLAIRAGRSPAPGMPTTVVQSGNVATDIVGQLAQARSNSQHARQGAIDAEAPRRASTDFAAAESIIFQAKEAEEKGAEQDAIDYYNLATEQYLRLTDDTLEAPPESVGSPAQTGISNLEAVATEKDVTIRGELDVVGMAKKEIEISAYFFDALGNRLMDSDGTNRSPDGQIYVTGVGRILEDPESVELSLTMPMAQLDGTVRSSLTVGVDVVAWDRSESPPRELFRSSRIYFEATVDQDAIALPLLAGQIRYFNNMPFVWIPPGTFRMGSQLDPETVKARYGVESTKAAWFNDEHPAHEVKISSGFWLSQHEVSVGDFRQFVDATQYTTEAEKENRSQAYLEEGKWADTPEVNWRNPGWEMSEDDNHPVVHVSWNDAKNYCMWLGDSYRLPREAEWEYACRAATTSVFFWGDDVEDGAGRINAADGTEDKLGRGWSLAFPFQDEYWATAPVGTYLPNDWKLHDMLGNVREWCEDSFDGTLYPESVAVDPQGSETGEYRIVRGGSWYDGPSSTRSAYRDFRTPAHRSGHTGFRVLRVP